MEKLDDWTGHKYGSIHLYIYSLTDSSEFLSFQARAANWPWTYKNCKPTPALENSTSRNKCIFILCSLWLCNCFWLFFSSVFYLHRGGARRLSQWALMSKSVRYCCTLRIWVRNKSAPDRADSSFCFHQDRRMRGHRIQHAKCGAAAKSFESQRKARLYQEVT